MGTDAARFLFYLSAGCALTPFVLMYGAWIALRLHKLSVSRWRGYQRLWLRLGIVLILVGGGVQAFAPQAAHPAGVVALIGGVLNTLVAVFQGRIVDILTRKPPER